MIANSAVALDRILAAAAAHEHHNKAPLVGITVFVGLTVLLLITLQFNRDR